VEVLSNGIGMSWQQRYEGRDRKNSLKETHVQEGGNVARRGHDML